MMNYVPLQIKTIKSNTELLFDLYIYYKDQYICYLPEGGLLSDEKLDKLSTQSLATFFVSENQAEKMRAFLNKSLNETMEDANLVIEEKVEVVSGIAHTALSNLDEEISEDNYKLSSKAANSFCQLMIENPDALKSLFSGNQNETELIVNHSLEVCALASKLGQECRLRDDEMEDLSIAALIHDIGLAKLNHEDRLFFQKDRKQMESSELVKYRSHASDSATILSEKPYVTKRVETLLRNHEENLQGTGPNKLAKLTTLEEILCLVNAYDKRLIVFGETPAQAMKAFQVDELGNYSLNLIKKFAKVLKKEGLLT